MGDTKHKANLRAWVMESHGIEVNGLTVTFCHGCHEVLFESTMTLDHWPVPAFLGGTWTRNNMRPLCKECNNHDGGVMSGMHPEDVHEMVVGRVDGVEYLEKMQTLGLEPIRIGSYAAVHWEMYMRGKPWALKANTAPTYLTRELVA